MQNDKLLPCPFCGGEAEPTFLCNGRYNQIKCKTPKCIMNVDLPALYGSREEAIEKWNTRKPMERIVERLEKRKSQLEGKYKSGYGTSLELAQCNGAIIATENDIRIIKEVGGVDNG